MKELIKLKKNEKIRNENENVILEKFYDQRLLS